MSKHLKIIPQQQYSDFVLRISFVIRPSAFVINCSTSVFPETRSAARTRRQCRVIEGVLKFTGNPQSILLARSYCHGGGYN
ncbi:MAG: hypothetical protein JXB10_19260, partial [Pirellulales bacterium]|nr:hypothetical protein [Pirellulales bacterium]